MIETIPLTESATVSAAEGGDFLLRNDDGYFSARKAASCIVMPEAGDIVTFLRVKEGIFIVTVLLKSDESSLTLSVPKHLTIASESLHIYADNALCEVQNLEANGLEVTFRFASLRSFASSCEQFYKMVVSKLGSSHRYVEEVEEVQSGHIRHLCEGLYTVKSKNMNATAEDQMKLNADKIHLA